MKNYWLDDKPETYYIDAEFNFDCMSELPSDGRRRIFYIDMSDMPPSASELFLKRIQEAFKAKRKVAHE